MKITFLLQDTGTLYGAERATLDLAQALASQPDVEVSILLMEESRLMLTDSALRRAFQDAGLLVVGLPVKRAFSWALVRQIAAQLEDTDILHTVGYKADIHGGMAARFGITVPVVSTVHGWLFRPNLKERFYAWLNIGFLRRFQQVVALSHFYEDLLGRCGIPVQRIPSGLPVATVDRMAAARTRESGTPLVVGLMGRLSEEKNHAMCLRAAARLGPDAGARFLLAGDGPQAESIDAQIISQGLSSYVERTGYRDTSSFMAEIDVLLLCSRIENLPYVLLEGMAARLPLIVTRVGGMPDLVDEGVNGFLVDLDDDAALADRIRRLAQDPALGQRLGAAGRDKLEKKWTMDRCVKAHVEMYAARLESK